MNAAPTIARLVRPELCPPEAVLRCACEGLRALGLHAYAENIEYARRHQSHLGTVYLGSTIYATEAAIAVLAAINAPHDWQELAAETFRHLRDAEFRLPKALPEGGDPIGITTHAELLAWADPGDRNADATCGHCDGKESDECWNCDGAGTVAPAAIEASFFGRAVNLRLLWRYLRHLTSCTVEIRGDDDAFGMLRFDGDNWVLFIMPMRYGEPTKTWGAP